MNSTELHLVKIGSQNSPPINCDKDNYARINVNVLQEK